MRGEEVQVLGAGREGLICLPGTHSKWVEVRVARMMDPGALRPDAFRTVPRAMGELPNRFPGPASRRSSPGAMLAAKEAS